MNRGGYRHIWRTLNGPQELGHGSAFWVVFVVLGAGLLVYSLVGSTFSLSNLANFLAYVPMGLGLGLLWGYCGVLSFGQAAFFGVSGYVYGIVAGNLIGTSGGTLLAAACGIGASMLMATAFGYFVFYGQVSGWIIPLLTLVLSLILETFMAQTAGYQWRLGRVLFGGYNGMTNIPSLRVGPVEFLGASTAFYLLVVGVMIAVYLGLRLLVNSRYGHVVAGVREDAERTRMLGYNVDLIQVQVFTLAAGLAGLSGVLYVSWGNYMNPSSMGLVAATLPVIWTAVGGRHSLLAVLLSTVALRYLADALAVRGGEYAFLILGALLLTTMLFFPAGIVVSVARRWQKRKRRGTTTSGNHLPEANESRSFHEAKRMSHGESGPAAS
jgi:branched-chain amino acid transport system permease protein